MKLRSVTKAKAALDQAKTEHGYGSREERKAKKALRAARKARREKHERGY